MMRHINYLDAQRHCARLADKIRCRLGSKINSCQFFPIPRGGLIILGMLSYLLDLDREQILNTTGSSSDLVIVVDDCALSGARFSSYLHQLAAPQVIFAHLLSHPELRRSILAQEPRVVDCLAADDLHLASAPVSPYAIPVEKRHHLTGKRYWIGRVENFSFAWSVPETVTWNEKEQAVETWYSLPPSQFLKGVGLLGLPYLDPPIARKLDLPDGIFWKIKSDEIAVWNRRSDQVYGFKDLAGDIWRALAAYGDMDAAVQYLIGQYEIDPPTLQQDLQNFTQNLLRLGLLVETG